MLNNGNRTCGFEDVIVSYIYDEIATAERRKFETHLVDCSACTDEFASVSNARFSVFEWQKEEFAHLPTPEIVIPYSSTVKTAQEHAAVGLLTGLRGLLSGFGMPVTVAAALLVCLGLGFAAITFLGRSGQDVASNVKVESPVTQPVITDEFSPRADTVSKLPDVIETTPVGNASSTPAITPVKVVENRRSVRASSRVPVNGPRYQNTQQARKVPVLSNYDDTDDKSLRLSDLFNGEIGGIR